MSTCSTGVLDCDLHPSAAGCAPYDGAFMVLESSEWLAVLSFVAMGIMAFYVGANDVANAFGTSVGSRAISIKWALVLGGVANWAGSVTLGYGVSNTVQNGVADVNDADCWACGYCDSQMSVYAVGMLAALISAAAFICAATFMAMPVSTTHAIVGAVIGMTIFQVGGGCLDWNFTDSLSGIVASWAISPVMSGLIGIAVHMVTTRTIMASKHPVRNALASLPALYGLCSFTLLFMILLKSPYTERWSKGYMAIVSGGVGLLATVLVVLLLVPVVRARLPSKTGDELVAIPGRDSEAQPRKSDYGHSLVVTPTGEVEELDEFDRPSRARGYSVDSYTSSTEDDVFFEEYSKLTVDEKDTMFVFRYLLIVVATANSYAHGANDTANATGPMGAIYRAYTSGLDACATAETDEWVMAIAGGCICLGVVVQGIPVMRTIGSRISVIDMHRAFSMEISSTITVVVATLLNAPVSTTHCQVGSVLFVSMYGLGWRNVSFPMMGRIVLSWLLTVPVSALGAAFLTIVFRSAIVQ